MLEVKRHSHIPLGRIRWLVILAACLLAAVYFGSFWYRVSPEQAVVEVSQRGREFRPGHLDLNRDATVDIVNDDADFTHHTYIASEQFSFDSGDQAPGRSVAIKFSKPGIFDVLCGIHPKMRLTVTVR